MAESPLTEVNGVKITPAGVLRMDMLKDKVCVITGGASGIGRGTVDLFLRQGAMVVVADVQDEKGRDLERQHAGKLIYCHTDVSNNAQVKAAIDTAVERFGRIDTLFNNAGIGGPTGPVADIDPEAFDAAFAVLVRGVFLGTKHAAPHMIRQKSGSIINTGSTAIIHPGPALHTYSAAKAAVGNFSRSTAMELGNWNIRVNCLCPGSIATPLFAISAGASLEEADKSVERVAKNIADWGAIPRAGTPDDIAQAALWFASDFSTFVTGQILVIDGGRTVGSKWVPGVDPRTIFGRIAGITPDDSGKR
jgi:NAD(P)-dependent dehydrogenase (short-subunit alcohol dehydrogenase family)